MKCTLMHKRIAVADIELDDATGFIQKVSTVYAPEHLPIGVPVCQETVDRAVFNEWWTDRSIPASRSGIRKALETLEWCGFAPIYDSGSALSYDKVAGQIRTGQGVECKPFKKHHEEQIKLVSDFSWIPFEQLNDVEENIAEDYSHPMGQ